MSDVVYLYGFLPPDAPVPPPDLAGIADARVRVIELGPVRAAISHVPAAEYRPDLIEARLQDLAWVGEQGMAHERVVLWFVDHSQILPARLFTLYTSADVLTGMALPRAPQIHAALTAIGPRREWNLKVAYDADTLARHAGEVSAEIAGLDAEIADAAPGRRFLLERKRKDLLKGEVVNAARRLAEELAAQLGTHADSVLHLPLADTDRGGTVVLNTALLVSRDREESLRADADRLATQERARGMIVSFSGPWAAYRFIEQFASV